MFSILSFAKFSNSFFLPNFSKSIDAFLSISIDYEKQETPSLTGFLSWISASNFEVKRQLSSQKNQIRVMTIHGAKGLESPIVILPETQKRKEEANPLEGP